MGSLWCPNPAAVAAPTPGRDQQEWAGVFPDTGKGDGSHCCQQSPLERLDLPKPCCLLVQESLAQEVSWIRSIERFLKPLTELGFSSRESLDVGCVLCSGLGLRLSQQDSGPALWQKGAASVSPRQAPRGVPGQVPLSQLWEWPAGLCWALAVQEQPQQCSSPPSIHPSPRNAFPARVQHTNICSVEKPLASCR